MILYECEYCEKVFTRKLNLLRHYDRKFKCNETTQITVVKIKNEQPIEEITVVKTDASIEEEIIPKKEIEEEIESKVIEKEEPEQEIEQEIEPERIPEKGTNEIIPEQEIAEINITDKIPYVFNEYTKAKMFLTILNNKKRNKKFQTERKIKRNFSLTRGFKNQINKINKPKTVKKYSTI